MSEDKKWWKQDETREQVLKYMEKTEIFNMFKNEKELKKALDAKERDLSKFLAHGPEQVWSICMPYLHILIYNSSYASRKRQMAKYGAKSCRNMDSYAESVRDLAQSLEKIGAKSKEDVVQVLDLCKICLSQPSLLNMKKEDILDIVGSTEGLFHSEVEEILLNNSLNPDKHKDHSTNKVEEKLKEI